MNLLDNNSVWQAHNLPDGLSINNGIISGTPLYRGSFSVPVTVTNSLGSDSKNINIRVKHRNDCYIRKNGEIIETLTPDELLASIQDGSAEEKYNCYDTQLLITIVNPINKISIDDVPLNFCDFRNVTLQNGSTRKGLILQFANPLWRGLAIFDSNGFNRWKYSNLRFWLNSSGKDWFAKAYNSDALTFRRGAYSDISVNGFLSYLPKGLFELLQPVKIITQAFFDDDNEDSSIQDPDFLDGWDCDITYDKVFIPALSEMNILLDGNPDYPEDYIEGRPWAFYSSLFNGLDWTSLTVNTPVDARNIFSDLEGNSCALLTRSALVSGKTNITTLQKNNDYLELTAMDTYNSLLSPAPAFVLC